MGIGYDHYLFVEKTQPPEQLPSGEWTKPIVKKVLICKCREQVNAKGQFINSVDGKSISFGSLIHFSKRYCPKVKAGDYVIISNDPKGLDARVKGMCLRSTVGLLHSRLWV